jgi:hypothetical protein
LFASEGGLKGGFFAECGDVKRLNGVHAVFCFVENLGESGFEDVVSDFECAGLTRDFGVVVMEGGQAVEED